MNGKPVVTVPAKSVINFDSGFRHKLLCDGPTFSTGSACAYSCAFCYVPDLMRKNPHAQHLPAAFEKTVILRGGAIAAMERQLLSAEGRRLSTQHLTAYASPLVDVAANMDLVHETIQACKLILDKTKWDIRLLSKSNLLPKVADGLLTGWAGHRVGGMPELKRRMIFGVSTGTFNEGLARAFEVGTPLVSKRLASLHWLQDHGYRTFGMLCPSIPQHDYKAFSEQAAAAIRADLCEHVWAEVMNIRGESFTRTIQALTAAGFTDEATGLEAVGRDKVAWEDYSRATFEAHAAALPPGKLRFLQYVTAASKPWWASNVNRGAVLL
jgi:DNA repair photolyase